LPTHLLRRFKRKKGKRRKGGRTCQFDDCPHYPPVLQPGIKLERRRPDSITRKESTAKRKRKNGDDPVVFDSAHTCRIAQGKKKKKKKKRGGRKKEKGGAQKSDILVSVELVRSGETDSEGFLLNSPCREFAEKIAGRKEKGGR